MKNKTKKITLPIYYTITLSLFCGFFAFLSHTFFGFGDILSNTFLILLSALCLFVLAVVCYNSEENKTPSFRDHFRYNLFFYLFTLLLIMDILLINSPLSLVFFVLGLIVVHFLTTSLINFWNKSK